MFIPGTNPRRGFAMILVVVMMGVLSVMSLALVDRMVWSCRFSQERERLTRVFFVNQAGKELAIAYLKNNPATLFYTSPVWDLDGLSGVVQGQCSYQIEDVTPPQSNPLKKITVTGWFPSQDEALVQKGCLVYVEQISGSWSVRSEFQPDR